MVSRAIAALRPDALLVVLCQVPPGFTRSLPQPSERRYYQVETLVFGQAVERAMKPERFIVGCERPDLPLDPRLATFLASFNCPILPMRYESAELAKISINMCLIASVSVANVMAEICEKIGADWSEIVPSLKLDRRIGPYSYLTAGMGISGGNLERDLTTVQRLAETYGTHIDIVKAWQDNSRHRKEWAWRTLREMVLSKQSKASVAVWGLAYKENTYSTKNSPALVLLSHLRGHPVTAYDPVVPVEAAGTGVKAARSPLDAAEGADVLCIMTPWPEFRSVAPADIAARMRGRVVLDPYRMLDTNAVRAAGLRCATLGAVATG
jgi:UDPglucose 6-dehydrogenase